MTTAGRPTFDPAQGREKDLSAITTQYSSRDLPSHTKLKYRERGQGTVEEIKSRDLHRELEERERDAQSETVAGPRRQLQAIREPAAKKPKLAPAPASLDADDPLEEDSDSGSEDDDTEALMAELQRIRKERAADLARREARRQLDDERIRMENILNGNPLLSYSAESAKADKKIRRGWDDDVVFKNCARSEPKERYEFVNDSLRSAFHRKFLEKYVK